VIFHLCVIEAFHSRVDCLYRLGAPALGALAPKGSYPIYVTLHMPTNQSTVLPPSTFQHQVPNLAPISHFSPSTCKSHNKIPKVILLYHYGPSTPAPSSSPSPHCTCSPYLCSRVVLHHARSTTSCLPMLHRRCGAAPKLPR
jgi:hypothetical protein